MFCACLAGLPWPRNGDNGVHIHQFSDVGADETGDVS